MKNKQYNRMLQVLVDTDTYDKINRLMMMEALQNERAIQTKSAWLRDLIEDTVNFQLNKNKIGDWRKELIKELKSK